MLRNSTQNFDDFVEDVEYFSNKIKNIPIIREFKNVYGWQFMDIFKFEASYGNECIMLKNKVDS